MSKQLLIPYNHIHILSNVVRSAINSNIIHLIQEDGITYLDNQIYMRFNFVPTIELSPAMRYTEKYNCDKNYIILNTENRSESYKYLGFAYNCIASISEDFIKDYETEQHTIIFDVESENIVIDINVLEEDIHSDIQNYINENIYKLSKFILVTGDK